MVSGIKMERIKGETWDSRERKAFPLERKRQVSSGKCRLFRILIAGGVKGN